MICHYDQFGNATSDWLRAMREMEADCVPQVIALVPLATEALACAPASSDQKQLASDASRAEIDILLDRLERVTLCQQQAT